MNLINCFNSLIKEGIIVGIDIPANSYQGENIIDVSGRYISPGLIDSHLHIESSMSSPIEFAKQAVKHGTTTIFVDPHEIANVSGRKGIDLFLKQSGFDRYYRGGDISDVVELMAKDAALHYEYLVCSAQDLKQIRHLSIKKICPGIRPLWYKEQDDQERIATPSEAISNGVHLLVVGRPILNADNIVNAIKMTNEEIWEA